MYRLRGRTAIVTGVSHDHGIGAAVCKKLAESGADIYFTYWEAETGWTETFLHQLQSLGVRCAKGEWNLADPTVSEKILDHVEKTGTTPAILVNNAAFSERDGYRKLNAKMLDDHYDVNMRGTFLLSVEFARRFERSGLKSGRIINLTSGQEQGPMMEELAYSATKAAISSFTRTLAAEVAPLGLTVNAVNPGPTDTGWMSDEVKAELMPKFRSGRAGLPEDAAKLIAFLASDESAWITGQTIHSEGGFLRG